MPDYFALTMPDLYPWVALVGTLNAVHYMVINFLGGSKRKFFSTELMTEHFGREHWDNFNKDPVKGGYPDCGSGRYSEKLSYE